MIGQWIGASVLLGRPVPVDAPYPHVCRMETTGRMTGHVRMERRDCAACAAAKAPAGGHR
ncbi:hypothetical protein [Micromonospora endolithica]|uniref:Uncharacterized protein n=1 Tax=Micromonospora endolithica TaxID=230091 RepID=A0A3A9YR37_9ACTN|nr:hypothetical protein [Micromonospora endolithica]RKN38472.1 hypothetical protein D7223_31200 [Micromonospora endolithica]TWJ23105.1 hypothetical protein JD76_03234 [Micromonospora endolithica]